MTTPRTEPVERRDLWRQLRDRNVAAYCEGKADLLLEQVQHTFDALLCEADRIAAIEAELAAARARLVKAEACAQTLRNVYEGIIGAQGSAVKIRLETYDAAVAAREVK